MVLPAVFGNDVVKVAAKFLQRRAVGNGLVHRFAKIRHHVEAVGTSDDKGVVMLGAVDVGVALGRQVELATEIVNLLGKGELRVREAHAVSVLASWRPARWAAVVARAKMSA